jgi:LPS export ABC transporter protein LptC
VTARSRPFLAALLFAGAALFACGEEDEGAQGTAQLPSGPSGYPTPDQVVENGTHVITVEGVRKALVRAEQLYFFDQLGKVVGDTIEVTFYNAEGVYESTLTARSGELEQATQDMRASGDVFVRGQDSSIRTQELHYEPAENRVWTDVQTEIVQRGNTIRGRGVTADPGLRNIRITGGSAVLRSEPELGPPPDTTAQPAPTLQLPMPQEPPPDDDGAP